MAQIKYVDSNGLKKVQQDYVAKIAEAVKDVIKNVTVQGQAAVVAEGTATVDLTSVLKPYAKQEDLEKIVGHIKLEGSCLKADLTEKASTAKAGSIWIVTDDDNHFYLFVGAEAEGSANGWIDLGGHTEIKLDEYLKTATADETYVKIATGVTQLKDQLDAAYCKVEDGYLKSTEAEETYVKIEGAAEQLASELDEVYCKVADNYVKTETADTTYVKVVDMVALTDTEIEQALGLSA